MAAGLPHIDLGDVRGADQLVVVPVMFFLPVILDQLAEQRPLRLPEDQTRSHLILNGKELKLLADPAVIPLLGLFQLQEILLEGLGVEEGGSVQPLQHGPFFITTPVGARHPGQLAGAEQSHMGQMRPPAEINEFADLIEGDRFFAQIADEFDLVGLPIGLEEPDRLVGVDGGPHKRGVAGDDLLHPRLDPLEIVRRKGVVEIEIIIEAVGNGRPDGHLDILAEQIHHRMGHEMGRAVAQNLQPLGHLDGDRLEIAGNIQGRREIDNGAVDAYGDGPLAHLVGYQFLERRLGGYTGRKCFWLAALRRKIDVRHDLAIIPLLPGACRKMRPAAGTNRLRNDPIIAKPLIKNVRGRYIVW